MPRPPDLSHPLAVPPETSSDVALVARVADGDQRALGALYDRHADAVYALCLAIVREPSDAQDAVAATFVQLWRHAARFDAARGSVGAWITMTARTRALDVLRARRRRAQVVERAAADDAEGFALPAPQRQAIELAFLGGLTHGEVADALGQPLGTVKTRIRDGLRRLRTSLAGLRAEGHA